jgi:hypothetical protein
MLMMAGYAGSMILTHWTDVVGSIRITAAEVVIKERLLPDAVQIATESRRHAYDIVSDYYRRAEEKFAGYATLMKAKSFDHDLIPNLGPAT